MFLQIIIIYAVDYAKLTGAGEMVAVQSVACFYNARIHRCTALAQVWPVLLPIQYS